MSKPVIMSASAAVAVIGAATYYVSPASLSENDVRPVYTSANQADAMGRLERLNLKTFMLQAGKTGDLERVVQESMKRTSDNSLQYQLKLGNEPLMDINVTLTPSSQGGTEVDIQPVLASSRFAKSDSLHPYDLKAMTAMTDLLASEYFESVLDGRRMASSDELKGALDKHVGFSDEQWKAFGKRVEVAFNEAYGAKLKSKNYSSGWNERYYGEGNHTFGGPDSDPDAAVRAAERAAESARRAASAAAR